MLFWLRTFHQNIIFRLGVHFNKPEKIKMDGLQKLIAPLNQGLLQVFICTITYIVQQHSAKGKYGFVCNQAAQSFR